VVVATSMAKRHGEALGSPTAPRSCASRGTVTSLASAAPRSCSGRSRLKTIHRIVLPLRVAARSWRHLLQSGFIAFR
jgi:hypothetical protein